MKDKLNNLENRSSRNNLKIDGIIEEENKSLPQKVKKMYRKSSSVTV